ncbi:hypothetical protein BJ875DRAFT_477330 [Amylocarpus encephaloides]|uniref:Alpha-ketoglutarate-dependent dioxygenase AlkB-like domain-containing protein n=1 Tax=Amylocarpus encephaloides TaxID=45428 RepID=A0A9P7Y846_9HELO|nr:hypothetical protein BJ875DRAFT_477330 [Amylocarpus encephaloides]
MDLRSSDELSSPLSSPPTSPMMPPSFRNSRTIILKISPGSLRSLQAKFEGENRLWQPASSPSFALERSSSPDLPLPRSRRKRARISLPDSKEPSTPRKAKRPSKTASGNRRRYVKKTAVAVVQPQANKPSPIGKPEAWADKRQQLCTTLPWYRAYQSGAYTHDGVALGLLCDKEVGIRDKFESEVVICRVGGGRSQDEKGEMVQVKDQENSTIALSFRRSMVQQQPMGVIVGQGNPLSPSKMPHYYNVLDWFHVTNVWCELVGKSKLKVWMARLEKIDLHNQSWWAPVGSCAPSPPQFGARCTEAACIACREMSKEIYNAGWACLDQACGEFFKFPTDLDNSTLDYNAEFLAERTPYPGRNPGPLTPPLLTEEDVKRMGVTGVEREFKGGIVCQDCGCCIRRREWHRWSCENANCSFTYRLTQETVSPQDAIAGGMGEEVPAQRPFHHSTIHAVEPKVFGKYDVYEYHIPGERGEIIGFVRHFKSSGLINQQPDGPNDLFKQMQTGELDLRRNPARQAGAPGEILTSHWAANWGAPYKYGVAQMSKGFNQSPPVILKALHRLTWASKHALEDDGHAQSALNAQAAFVPFNELLTLGYFEDSDIGFHDDGEKELGPTVATLSLGCSATMAFRPKAKSSIQNIRRTRNAKGTKAPVLKILLEHGDILIMHGREIQKHYEHAVKPHGKLRFAMTSRYVKPELMAPDQRAYAALAGQLPPGADKYAYDGDMSAVPVMPAVSIETEIRKTAGLIKAQVQLGEIDREKAIAIFDEVMG